jgi:hypothetical protein
LNILGGYATRDHRANAYQEKKACIEIPLLPQVRQGGLEVQHIHRLSTVRYRGRNALTSGSL